MYLLYVFLGGFSGIQVTGMIEGFLSGLKFSIRQEILASIFGVEGFK